MSTSVESVQDGSWFGRSKRDWCGAAGPTREKLADTIYRRLAGYKRVNPLTLANEEMGPFQGPATSGIGKSNSGAYCWAPNTSRSPGLPLGRSRLIVNLIASAGSNSTNAVRRSRETP